MFRRRPIRRPLRPPRGRRPGRAPRALIAANQMMETGNYTAAAERFEAIAQAAESRGGPRAPQFFLQAGRARILAGQTQAGMAHLKNGLTLLARRSAWGHLYRAGNRVVEELDQRGLKDESQEISVLLDTSLPENFTPGKQTAVARKPILPTHCPSCGAALRPDEVDWLDEITAECTYCGSPVREAE